MTSVANKARAAVGDPLAMLDVAEAVLAEMLATEDQNRAASYARNSLRSMLRKHIRLRPVPRPR